jgi:hypothetical protein
MTVLLVGGAQRLAFAQADAANADPPAQAPPPITPPASPQGLMGEPGFITSAMGLVSNRVHERAGQPKSGFYPEVSNMLTGSGWVSLGPGYRHYFMDDRAYVDTSAAVSWRLYKMAQARFEMPKIADGHLAVGAQGMWQDATQVSYFGIGPAPNEDARSVYRLQTHDFVGYATVTPITDKEWFTFGGNVGWLGHPALMDQGGTFKRSDPETINAFPADPAVSLSEQPAFIHATASMSADTRDHRGYPKSGFLYRAAMTSYSDRTTGFYSFRQYEGEALEYIPLADSRVVLALHGWAASADAGGDNGIPFYMLPALGGGRTLRAYHDFQFHDRQLLVVNAESRFAVWEHMDAALFVDAGNVAARFGDLNLDKTSVGAGLRLHSDTTTIARLDMAHGAQGWHMVVSTSEPLRLPRARRQIAMVPFAP